MLIKKSIKFKIFKQKKTHSLPPPPSRGGLGWGVWKKRVGGMEEKGGGYGRKEWGSIELIINIPNYKNKVQRANINYQPPPPPPPPPPPELPPPEKPDEEELEGCAAIIEADMPVARVDIDLLRLEEE